MNIENILSKLENISVEGTRVPGFKNKVMIDAVLLMSLGEEIRNSVPASIDEAGEVISQKTSIINQANLEAQRIKNAANEESAQIIQAAHTEHDAKVSDSEVITSANLKADEIQQDAQQIMTEAQKKAYVLLSEAEQSALSKTEGADQYAREVLFNLEERISETLSQIRRGIDSIKREEKIHVNGNGSPN